MEWWHAPLLAIVGVVAGWLNVMAGGGSMLTVPTMVLLGLPGPVANGTNRVAIVAQNIVAVSTFRRRGISNLRLSLTLALAAVPGAVLGALLGTRLDGVWFNRTLAIVMIVVMVLMWTHSSKSGPDPGETETPPQTRKRLIAGHLLMPIAGFWGGFIQIGVGFILMPILHRVIGLDLVTVNMHKVTIVLVFTCVSLAIFASQVELLWLVGLSLAIGNSIGGWLGAHTSVARGEGLIRIVLNLALAGFVVRLVFF